MSPNEEKKPGQSGGLRRLSKSGALPKPTPQNLVEQVPPWLKRLLTKYGEREGPLVGLGEGEPEAETLVTRKLQPTGGLTALLDQMAEEGVSTYSPERSATSVEWGSYDEPEPPPIDDFLANLGTGQGDYQDVPSPYSAANEAPDWINDVLPPASQVETGYSSYSPGAEPTFAEEAPDWLTEMLPPDAATPPPPPASPTRVEEAPDWLAEALEIPTPSSSPPPPSTAPLPATPPGSGDLEVPDWLTAALETPSTSAAAPSPSLLPAEQEGPDWLADLSDRSPASPQAPVSVQPAPLPPTEETAYGVEVPDWLEGLVAPSEPDQVETSEPDIAVPDWIASISAPAETGEAPPAASTWDAPDWITRGTPDRVETEAKPGPAAQENESWFAQGQDLPSLDWLFEGEPAPPAQTEAQPPVQDYTDWLFDSTAEVSSPPAETGSAWLEELDQNATPDWLAESDTSETPPDWLTSLESVGGETYDANQPTEAWLDDTAEETPPWLAETVPPPSMPAAPEPPPPAEPSPPAPTIRSLKPLKRLSPQPEVPAESPLPDWAAGLVPAEAETSSVSPALPDWAADLVPPGAGAAKIASSDLPDWAKSLLPSDAEAKAEPPAAATPRPLSRLSSMAKPAPETPPAPVEPAPEEISQLPLDETPEWLSDVSISPPATEAPAWMTETGPTTASSNWLSDLPGEADETPDWMAELSRLSQDVTETPAAEDWPLEESPAEDDSGLMERLGWFTQDAPPQSAAFPAEPPSAAAEPEMLDWLADWPAQTGEKEPPAASVEAAADDEIPSWLTDLPGTALANQSESPELEMPDWFSASTEPAASETSSPPATEPVEADLETLPWLTDVPAADLETPDWLRETATEPATAFTPVPPTFETEAETEESLETPDWLMNLLETAEPESSEAQPVEPGEGEEDTPPWLAQWPGLSETVPPAETTDNEEMPAWLSGLSKPSTPAWVDEATTESELEAPPWLTDLSQPAAAEAETAAVTPSAASIEPEPEGLSWLADLREESAPDMEEEAPGWLEDLPLAEEATTEAGAEVETELPSWLTSMAPTPETEALEVGLPSVTEAEQVELDWLAELPPVSEAELAPSAVAATDETEAEEEIPAWLSQFSTAPVEPAEGTAETLLETPDWLRGLPETPESEPATGETEEAPSWLAEVSPTMESESGQPDLAEEIEPAIPSWLADLRPPSEAEIAPVDLAETTEDLETPSWLSELPETVAETGPEDTELEIPAWLTGVAAGAVIGAVVPETSEAAEPTPEEETPDWLAELPEMPEGGMVDVEGELETPDWLSELPEMSVLETTAADAGMEAESDLELPSWLTELPGATTPEAEAAALAADLETPAWLSELPQAAEAETTSETVGAETEVEIPSWLTGVGLSETAETSEAVAATGTPDWLAELSQIPEAETVEEEIEADLEMPAWLSELPEAPGTEAITLEVEGEAEPEAPSWLSELPEAPTAEAELEMPSWLGELPQASSAETPGEAVEAEVEAELEIPAWLSEFPQVSPAETAGEAVEAEAELEMPSWLSELPGTPTAEAGEAIEAEAELEMPSWMSELSETPAVETGEAETEAELEMPAWLSELPQASPVETRGEVVEAEPEAPSWLSELPEAPATETVETEAELEMPSWLSELPISAAEPVETETELEMPAWLSESSAAPVAEAEPETEEELVIPSWLTGVATGAALGAVAAETSEAAEPELAEETPDWLAELTPAPESRVVATETEAELEMPSWVSELPAAETETVAEEAETDLETPEWLSELPETTPTETTAETDLEAPDWLSEIEPATETATEPIEAEAELEMPTWLSDLPQVAESETETTLEAETDLVMPSWLTGLREAPASEMEAADAEAETDLDTPAGPGELPETPADEVEAEKQEELVIPAWLTGMVGAATGAAAVEAAEVFEPVEETPATETTIEEAEIEGELEIPAWLRQLPGEPTFATEIPEGESDEAEAELEMPAWLSELPSLAEAEPTSASPVETEAELEMPVQEVEGPAEVVEEVEAFEQPQGEGEEELEIPPWLAGIAAATGAVATTLEPAAVESSPSEVAEFEAPDWSASETISIEEESEEVPAWLADLSTEELKLPSWLSDTPEFATAPAAEAAEAEVEVTAPAEQVAPVEEAAPVDLTAETAEDELPPESDWLAGLAAATAAVQAALPSEKVEESDFLTSEEEPELPDWLTDSPKTAVTSPAAAPAFETLLEDQVEAEPPAPDWLTDSTQVSTPLPGPALTGEPKASPTERMSDWLRGLQPSEETLAEEDNKIAETTGVLAGLGPLLPAEKIALPTPLLDSQATASTAQGDAMLEAARHFYAIATQAPQPVALPEALPPRASMLGNIVRGGLYLLFIILVALPLIPGLQKVTDPASGQKVAWTEPAGALSEVLDKQRRELISVQLGVIDLQQPDSVALVSFDYTTATQGEMQPLAEAIIGRLRGQGMRLIFMSLEPEGTALAQHTIEAVLAERGETYGAEMVNLGYVPGQIAGIRELVTGRKQLAGLADVKEGLTFAAPERSAWSQINNLGQVDVVITLSDNPATARWWIEQMAAATPPDDGERYLLAATSATADPFVRPYLDTQQLDGLISGINGAAAIEAGRKNFGPARQMLDSQGIAHLLIVILIALGTMFGWMPPAEPKAKAEEVNSDQ
ncbi:MAG: hypothetical protein DPW09_07680 [Anaerolineae bacterium]|nr:hypothetical protein [Anaerolineales bacterium]MCQ3973308.1 hypothetical protein [Anaerolineae bacterium]